MTLRGLIDSPWTYYVAAAILAVVAVATQFELNLPARSVESAEAIPALRERDDLNVVFIVVDTLRSDRLGVYGYGRPTSPTLDALARSGVVFERVVAQSSWTKTSMVSLWTGIDPVNHGVLRYGHAIPEEPRLPAEILKDEGFRTAGIWRNGWVSANFGFAQGFDTYMKPVAGRERKQMQRRHPGTPRLRGTDEDIAESAIEFLDTVGDRRFFMYLHFMDVHQYVFDEAAAKFGTSYSDAYDQAINWTDRVIAHILSNLEQRDLLDRSLVVITSDHGEEFREHGGEGHARHLHREVVSVPLIFIFPFRLDPGLMIEQLVSNVDVWPTILDLLGLPPLENADGTSLVPLMMAAAGAGDGSSPRPAFSQLDRSWGRPTLDSNPILSVSDGDLRLLMQAGKPESAQLYDVASDPLESRDLAEERAEDLARLIGVAEAYLADPRDAWGAPPGQVELNEMRLDQLRALGYVIK